MPKRCEICAKNPVSKKYFNAKVCEEDDCISEYRKLHYEKSKSKEVKKLILKYKLCKGSTESTKTFGCGKPSKNRKFGLGIDCKCYTNWLLNSDAGKEHCKRVTLKITSHRINLQQAFDDEKLEKSLKASIINTKTQVHSYIRERDKGKPCISCGCDWNINFEAGHYFSASSFITIKFHLDNINSQCVFCNNYQEGKFDEYTLRLPKRIGVEKFNEITRLAGFDKHYSKVWNLENLKEVRKLLKKEKSVIIHK